MPPCAAPRPSPGDGFRSPAETPTASRPVPAAPHGADYQGRQRDAEVAGAALTTKDHVLRLFKTKMKKPKTSEGDLTAFRMQIEAGKIDPKAERDANRRRQALQDGIARDCPPEFERKLKTFETFPDEFRRLPK